MILNKVIYYKINPFLLRIQSFFIIKYLEKSDWIRGDIV